MIHYKKYDINNNKTTLSTKIRSERIRKQIVIWTTVLPAKSDSGLMFVYKVIRDLRSIDHLCINPIHRIGLIHIRSIDLRHSSEVYM